VIQKQQDQREALELYLGTCRKYRVQAAICATIFHSDWCNSLC